MKIIFMGSSEFAVPALKALSCSHSIIAVFTQAPKPCGRGLNVVKSPIHVLAEHLGIQVYTPTGLKNSEIQDLISKLVADVIVVAAYGFIIPQPILVMKKYGCINIHPSMLPKFRGAAPLQRVIIGGEKETAVCIIQMDQGLDTGDILLFEKFSLNQNICLTELHDKCAKLGAKLIVEVVNNISILPRIPQAKEGVSYAYKLSKEEGKINWHRDAYTIDCQVRGMNPWPGTFFEHNNKNIKVLKASVIEKDHNLLPGTVIDNNLTVACKKDLLQLQLLQLPGKKILTAKEFLRGYNIFKDTILLSCEKIKSN